MSSRSGIRLTWSSKDCTCRLLPTNLKDFNASSRSLMTSWNSRTERRMSWLRTEMPISIFVPWRLIKASDLRMQDLRKHGFKTMQKITEGNSLPSRSFKKIGSSSTWFCYTLCIGLAVPEARDRRKCRSVEVGNIFWGCPFGPRLCGKTAASFTTCPSND